MRHLWRADTQEVAHHKQTATEHVVSLLDLHPWLEDVLVAQQQHYDPYVGYCVNCGELFSLHALYCGACGKSTGDRGVTLSGVLWRRYQDESETPIKEVRSFNQEQ